MADMKDTQLRNLITDVAGLRVGNAQDDDVLTGTTLILPDHPAVCGVDVRGGGPATRETDALRPENLVEAVDAIVLSGGSVYGLAAADAVTAHMGSMGLGFGLNATPGIPKSPVIPAACLYDLANGGNKNWGAAPPYQRLGLAAYEAAAQDFDLGAVGAGTGARAGSLRGGLGSASHRTADGMTVGALVAVNCFGSVIIPNCDAFWAWPLEQGGEAGGKKPPADLH
ncbi:MAG: hypothetical protein RLZZ157_1753, partial [Pseudomonadota bacterium]